MRMPPKLAFSLVRLSIVHRSPRAFPYPNPNPNPEPNPNPNPSPNPSPHPRPGRTACTAAFAAIRAAPTVARRLCAVAHAASAPGLPQPAAAQRAPPDQRRRGGGGGGLSGRRAAAAHARGEGGTATLTRTRDRVELGLA